MRKSFQTHTTSFQPILPSLLLDTVDYLKIYCRNCLILRLLSKLLFKSHFKLVPNSNSLAKSI